MKLIGRDDELAAVDELVDAAASSTAKLLVLGAEGVGKSALAGYAHDRALQAGFTVLAAYGCPSESEDSFATLCQLLSRLAPNFAALSEPHREAIEIALGLTPADDGPDPALLRAGVLALIQYVSKLQPLALIVDDLQWADPDSIWVVSFLLRHLCAQRVALVVTVRGTIRPPQIESLMPTIALGRLSDADAVELLDRVPDPPTGRIRLEVLDAAAGNPLALIELAHAARTKPSLLTPPTEAAGTGRIEEMYAHQIRALPPSTARMLRYAAAAQHSDVASIMAASGERSLDVWGPAEHAGLVSISEGRLMFRHPLIRAAVTAIANSGSLAQAHRDFASLTSIDPARRAWHLACATVGPDENVARQLEATADLARRRGGNYAAARALERAAEFSAAPGDKARRYTLAIRDADEFGDPSWIRELYGHVVQAGPRSEFLGVAAAAAGHALSLAGRQREAFSLLRSALTDSRSRGHAGTALALTAVLSAVTLQSGLPEHRRQLLETVDAAEDDGAAVEVEDALELTPPEARPALKENIRVQAAPELHATAVIQDKSAAVNQQLEGPAELLRLLCLGATAWFADESALCAATFRRVIDALDSRRTHGMVVMCVPAYASALIHTGQWAEADALLRDVHLAAAVHQLSYLRADVGALRTELDALRGDTAGQRNCLDTHWQSVDLSENRATHARLLRAAGIRALAEGDGPTAFHHLQQLFSRDGQPLHPFLSARSVADLALAARLSGRSEEVESTLQAVRAAIPNPTARLKLLLHQADALTQDAIGGRGADAVESEFAAAVTDPAASQWPIERAQAQLHYARWLRRQRRRLDARPLLVAAGEVFTRAGASTLADAARRELRATGVSVTAANEGEDRLSELTPQEKVVVLLAARGLRNRAIGDQLYLSPRTVSTHLVNAYAKLGISSRHELGGIVDEP